MKSMTDFIMEQEAPQVVEESFNENELVSNFMGVCAASANVTCVLECANIVNFCNANDIAIPSIIQEGWADFWQAVKDFFKNIGAWFKSLVKGTTAGFAKNKLTSLIAKLKTFDGEESVVNNNGKNGIWRLAVLGYAIIDVLEIFRANIIEKIADIKADSEHGSGNEQAMYTALTNAEKYTVAIKDAAKWFNAAGEVKEGKAITLPTKDDGTDKNYNTTIKSGVTDPAQYKIKDLILDLEAINALDIPSKGEKILKQYDVTAEKLEASFVTKSKDATTGVETKTEDMSNAKVQKVVKEAADAIAKFYDKVKENMIKVSDLAYKDTEVAADKKKDYEKELERANKDTGRKDLHKGDTVKP